MTFDLKEELTIPCHESSSIRHPLFSFGWPATRLLFYTLNDPVCTNPTHPPTYPTQSIIMQVRKDLKSIMQQMAVLVIVQLEMAKLAIHPPGLVPQGVPDRHVLPRARVADDAAALAIVFLLRWMDGWTGDELSWRRRRPFVVYNYL